MDDLKMDKRLACSADVLPSRCVVLIPHYNNPDGLVKSLYSIGANEAVDVWVIDDGSQKKPDEISARKAFGGVIKFIYLPNNKGIQFALNMGLADVAKKYEYIARLDCGDICTFDRFSLQIKFLDENPEIMLLGSAVTFVDMQGRPQYTLTFPQRSPEIRHDMHLNCVFTHPAVIWRCSAMRRLGDYPTNYPMAEDYAFFWKFVQYFETANMPNSLVFCEINPSGLSISRRNLQLRSRLRLQLRYARANVVTICGIIKTLTLMITPYSIVSWLKRQRL